mgnify:CR=1 FL=1
METYTLTFGDGAEHHRGMKRMLGDSIKNGFNMEELEDLKNKFIKLGADCELYNLFKEAGIQDILEKEHPEFRDNYDFSDLSAGILVIKKGVNFLLENTGKNIDDVLEEQKQIKYDSKYWDDRREMICNKRARNNICFGKESITADFNVGQGTVVAYDSIPILKHIVNQFERFFGEKTRNLVGEGNYYFDTGRCGIGYHGDKERKIVIAMRFGGEMYLKYQWYYKNNFLGKNMAFNFQHGDIYIMSEKAVGSDWLKSNIPTLRHAAGAEKYTSLKNKF